MQAYVKAESKQTNDVDYDKVAAFANEQLRLNVRLLRMITKREDAHP